MSFTVKALQIFPWVHNSSISFTRSGCGSSHTLKTFTPFTWPNPLWVDCKLFNACLMSPWAVNTIDSKPSSVYETYKSFFFSFNKRILYFLLRKNDFAVKKITFSFWQTSITFAKIWASLNFPYLNMAQRDCIGSIIFSLLLHANANLVVLLYISIVRRRACCAPSVILSASSKIIILCFPLAKFT